MCPLFIGILILVLIVLIGIYLNYKMSNFETTNNEETKEIMKKEKMASKLLYLSAFAGKKKGDEDSSWINKLHNTAFNVNINYTEFIDKYANPSINVINGYWKFL